MRNASSDAGVAFAKSRRRIGRDAITSVASGVEFVTHLNPLIAARSNGLNAMGPYELGKRPRMYRCPSDVEFQNHSLAFPSWSYVPYGPNARVPPAGRSVPEE